MKTKSTTHTLALVSALIISAMSPIGVKAQTSEGTSALIYTNRAYVHSIHNAPNPVADKTVPDAEIIYVNKGYGQAINSYPGYVPFQHTDFNVEYVDTANGRAIYSYPNNNPKHHLKLGDNKGIQLIRSILPASLRMNSVPVKTAGAAH